MSSKKINKKTTQTTQQPSPRKIDRATDSRQQPRKIVKKPEASKLDYSKPDKKPYIKKKTDTKTIILYAVIIGLFAFLLYVRAVSFNYVYNDDNLFILDEPYRTFHSHLSNIGRAFTQGLTSGGSYYRPILSISWIIDSQIGGTKPLIYHLSNVIYHVIGSIMVFWALYKLNYSKMFSLIFGLLFAAHPILTPAACWISGRNDSLLAIFGLLSVISFKSYLEASEKRKWLKYFLHLLAFALTVYTKEVGVFFMFVGAAYIYIYHKNKLLSGKNITLYIGWFVVALIWFIMRQKALAHNPSPETIGMEAFVANYPSFIAVLGKMLIPLKMVALSSYESLSITAGIIVIIGLIIVMIFKKESRKGIVFGFLFYMFFIGPTLFVRLPGAGDYFDYVEHRSYLPLFGFLIMLIEVLKSFNIQFDFKKPIPLVIGVIVVLAFTVKTFAYQSVFDNRFDFWRNTMKIYPHKGRSYFDLGKAYMDIDSLDKAEKLYYEGLKLSPTYKGFYVDLSVLYIKRGNYIKSEEMSRKALAIDPNDMNASLNIAQALSSQGRFAEAIPYFKKAEPANRNKPEMYISMGVAYFNLRQLNEAVMAYQKALQLKPNYALGYSNLAAALFQMGNYKRAADMWMTAMKIDPDLDASYHNLIIYYCTITHEFDKAREIANKFQSRGRQLPQNLLNMIPPPGYKF